MFRRGSNSSGNSKVGANGTLQEFWPTPDQLLEKQHDRDASGLGKYWSESSQRGQRLQLPGLETP